MKSTQQLSLKQFIESRKSELTVPSGDRPYFEFIAYTLRRHTNLGFREIGEVMGIDYKEVIQLVKSVEMLS